MLDAIACWRSEAPVSARSRPFWVVSKSSMDVRKFEPVHGSDDGRRPWRPTHRSRPNGGTLEPRVQARLDANRPLKFRPRRSYAAARNEGRPSAGVEAFAA